MVGGPRRPEEVVHLRVEVSLGDGVAGHAGLVGAIVPQATGTIKVSNSTPVTISGILVSDAVDNGGSCSVDTSNFDGTLAAGSHVDLPYTCTYGSSPDAGTNTATAAWDSSTATGTAVVDFSAASINVTDGSITVTDRSGNVVFQKPGAK